MTIQSTVVEKWTLDAKDYERGLRSVERGIRESVRATKEAEKSTVGLTAAVAAGTLAANAYSLGLRKVREALASISQASLNFEDHVAGNERAVAAMSAAVDGIVSKDALSRLAELTTRFGYSQKAQEAAAKAAIEHARINKGDFKSSLDAVTRSIAQGTDRALRELGIDVELTGSKIEKAAKVADILEQKFGDMTVSVANTNEAISKLKSSWTDAVGEMGAAGIRALGLKNTFSSFADQISNTTSAIRTFSDAVGGFFDKFKTAAADRALGFLGLRGKDRAAMMTLLTGQGLIAGTERDQSTLAGGEAPTAKKSSMAPVAVPEVKGGLAKKSSGGIGSIKRDDFVDMKALREALEPVRAREQAADNAFDEQRNARLAAERAEKRSRDLAMKGMKAEGAEKLKLFQQNKALNESYKQLAVGGLAQFAGGLWSAADAAIQSGQGFAAAMANMVKSTLLGIAQQSTVLGVFEVAKALGAQGLTWGAPNPSSVNHWASAATYFAIAAGTGGVGLAISAATAPGSAGGGGRAGSADRSAPRASFGEREREREMMRKIIVQVYYGDSRDRGAMLMDRRRTEAKVAA